MINKIKKQIRSYTEKDPKSDIKDLTENKKDVLN